MRPSKEIDFTNGLIIADFQTAGNALAAFPDVFFFKKRLTWPGKSINLSTTYKNDRK